MKTNDSIDKLFVSLQLNSDSLTINLVVQIQCYDKQFKLNTPLAF